jgi:two-component system LytT family response regulator
MNELNTIIVEDEVGAANHLMLTLNTIGQNVVIRAALAGVEETIEWITSNPTPDLAFFDIQLADGVSFDIFKKCKVTFPVIFTTAYDQYAIDAFKVNSVDYLLKPIKEADLLFSIKKYKDLRKPELDQSVIQHLMEVIESKQKALTLLIRVKDKLIPVPENDFAYFHLENGLLKGRTINNHVFTLDETIEELISKLNKVNFFRANRQVIVSRSAVHEAEYYFNGRLALKLLHAPKEPVLISKARVQIFKEWWTQDNRRRVTIER